MRSLSFALLFALLASAAHAQKWANFATVSPTSNLVTNTLCYSDGRDLACDGAGGLLITSGTVAFSNVSATNISVSTINGKSASAGLGVSTLASLTDVSETGVSSGMLLRYNGSKWESVGASTALSTTTMIPNWPDAIMCKTGTAVIHLYSYYNDTGSSTHYYVYDNGTSYVLTYNSSGAYTGSPNGLSGYDCMTSSLSITQLYARGQAFNFIGSSLSSAANPNNGLQYSNNGTLTADSNLQWISSTASLTVSGSVSASTVTVSANNTGCTAANVGTFRRNPTTGRVEICQ